MTIRILAVWFAVLVACANATSVEPLSLSTDAVTLAAGRTAPVMAMGGSGGALVWTSDHPDIATVAANDDGSATITAVKTGAATVSASLGQVASSLAVTVTDAELDRIDITSSRDMLPRGLTLQLVATATYSDRHTQDLSSTATWASTDATIATIDPTGLVAGKAVGAATLSATSGAVTGTFDLAVIDAQLASIALAAVDPTLPKGRAIQLVVTGVFTDASTDDVTDLVTWTTTNDTAITISHGGLATAVAASGSAMITASADTLSDAVTIAAAPAALDTIAVGPSPLALALGVSQALQATGTYSDTTQADLTAQATWTIASGTAVTVSPAGLAHGAQQGTATVKAAVGAVAGTLDVSVGPAVIDHLALSSGDLALRKQQRAQLHAALVYSDLTTTDVTASATWTATGTTVTVAAGKLDAGTTAGATTITASASGKQASVVATVGSATCHPVISEVQASSASGAGDEWVELYNPCATTTDVSTWTLVYRSATTVTGNDTNALQALAGSMAPGDLRLYVGPGYAGTTHDGTPWGGASGLLQATNGGLGLRAGAKDTGPLVDAVAYGAVTAGHPFLETAAAPALASGKSIARLPFDGNDTDDGATDFALVATPTPRMLNAP